MIISERIFQLLEDRHMSIIGFSRLTGIPYSTINDWKRKHTNPAADKILIICKVLNVTPELLLSDSDLANPADVVPDYDVSIDSQELRLIENYRNLNVQTRPLLWAYLDALSKVKTLPDSDSPLE